MADYAKVEKLVDRYDRAVNGLEADVIGRLNDSLDASYRNLERELRRLYPTWQSQGSLYAVQRRLLLLEELKSVLEVVRPELRTEYEQLFQDAIALSHQTGGRLADELTRTINPGYPLREFADIPIEAVVLQARDGVERLYRYNNDFRRAVSGVVEQGLTQGWGAAKVARVLRGNDEMQGQFGIAQLKSKAETIARTEVLSALNDAAKQRYEQAGIGYVQWMATPSEALCRVCAARNMRVYKRDEVRLPAHPRCRCVWLPWMPEWQKDGLTDDEFAEEYNQKLLDDLKKRNIKPDYGPTYWEKKNQGLTEAPTAVWRPTAKAAPPSAPPPRSRPAASARSRRRPDALPSNHALTTNPRITSESLDNALNVLAENGAARPVSELRQFTQKHQVQVVFTDDATSLAAQRRANRAGLNFVPTFGSDGLDPLPDAGGYTNQFRKHVQVSTSSRGRAGRFAIAAEDIDTAVSVLAERADLGRPLSVVNPITSNRDAVDFVTYLHEVGHQVHYHAGYELTLDVTRTNWERPSFRPAGAKSISRYADFNDFEWFAESFSAYMLDPVALRAFDPVTADFVEATIKRAIAAPYREPQLPL